MLKVAVLGAKGRMGQAIISEIKLESEIELVAELGRPIFLENGQQTGGLGGVKTPFEVLIDFSNIDALDEHLKYCVDHNRKLVLGVTGLKETHFRALKEAASKIAIVYSPNMSVGVNLAFCMIEMGAKVLKEELEKGQALVSIHEVHHQGKKDAPSGTALKMQNIIATVCNDSKHLDKSTQKQAKELLGDALRDNIRVTYERVGEVKGEHSLTFSLKGEQLKLIHQAEDRVIFAKGALLAAKWLAQKGPGLYDMRDVLGLP